MRSNRFGIALMGEEVLEMDFQPLITANATSLVVKSFQKLTTHTFARLVGSCRELRHLDIAADRVSDLTSCVPGALNRLSYLYLHSASRVTAGDLAALMRLVPNIQSIGSLPPTSPLDRNLGSLGPRVLQTFVLVDRYSSPVLLRSLLAYRWNVRTIILSVALFTLQVLTRFDLRTGMLPSTCDLYLYIEDSCTDETAPLCALLAACRLRRLMVRASAARTAKLLAAALATTSCDGLRALSLSFEDSDPADEVQAAADALVGAMPRGLRSLKISLLPLYAPIFEALRPMCRTRRISFQIGGGIWNA